MSICLQLAEERFPNAWREGRVNGDGRYALLSCQDGPSRHVFLFESEKERDRLLRKCDGGDYPGSQGSCGAAKCISDYKTIEVTGQVRSEELESNSIHDGAA